MDLFVISDGRLRFKDKASGIITAKFMVTQEEAWRRIRLTYRRPGKALRTENYVVARLNQINRSNLASETLTAATSLNDINDTDEIRSIGSVGTAPQPLNFRDFFYQIEIVMRRSPLLVPPDSPVAEAITLSGVYSLARDEAQETKTAEGKQLEAIETPSVPIPPPSESEIAAITLLTQFGAMLPPGIGVLTPSPEFILAQLFTTA
jgi:hypothetical protein